MPSQCSQAAAAAEQKHKASEGTAQNTQHHHPLAKLCQCKMNAEQKFAIISILPVRPALKDTFTLLIADRFCTVLSPLPEGITAVCLPGTGLRTDKLNSKSKECK